MHEWKIKDAFNIITQYIYYVVFIYLVTIFINL